MIWFKACPKCQGDLHKNRDMYGEFISCLQCGYYLTDSESIALLTAGRVGATADCKEREKALVA